MEQRDFDVVQAIMRNVHLGTATSAQKLQLREVLALYSERAIELPWWAVVEAADDLLAIPPVADSA